MPPSTSACHALKYLVPTACSLIVGPISSIFDICTFVTLWHHLKLQTASAHDAALFQTGWFVESLLTQTFVVHMLRTKQIPFIQSTATWQLLLSTFSMMAFGIILCYIPGEHAYVMQGIWCPLVLVSSIAASLRGCLGMTGCLSCCKVSVYTHACLQRQKQDF